MLDTLDKNNEKLIAYQNELETKCRELASAKEELQNHRQHLEELVEERTIDLKKINIALQKEIDEHRPPKHRCVWRTGTWPRKHPTWKRPT